MKKELIKPEDYPIYKNEPDLNFRWHQSWTKEEIEGLKNWVNETKIKKFYN